LRLTEFEGSNRPEVVIYLVEVDNSHDDDSVKNSKYISLGSMKGNIGNQNYEIPQDINPNEYRSVIIWCKRFGVNFATAPLKTADL